MKINSGWNHVKEHIHGDKIYYFAEDKFIGQMIQKACEMDALVLTNSDEMMQARDVEEFSSVRELKEWVREHQMRFFYLSIVLYISTFRSIYRSYAHIL